MRRHARHQQYSLRCVPAPQHLENQAVSQAAHHPGQGVGVDGSQHHQVGPVDQLPRLVVAILGAAFPAGQARSAEDAILVDDDFLCKAVGHVIDNGADGDARVPGQPHGDVLGTGDILGAGKL